MLKIRIKENEDLRRHTTFRIGGQTRYFLEAKTPEELVATIVTSKEMRLPYRVISGGSNVVFGDKIFPGLIIKFVQAKPNKISIKAEGAVVVCSANLSLKDLIEFSLKRGLGGTESLSGIPGFVAGALVGNAGAYGRSIGETVEWVEIFDGKEIKRIDKKACCFCYRDSVFKSKNWIVLRAAFRLKNGNKKLLVKKSKDIIEARNKKYPSGLMCPGSFFKNILALNLSPRTLRKIDKDRIIEGKIPAGYLLEKVGAKGLREGGLSVAEYHGNLIVNDGTGNFSDLEKLVKKLKSLVKKSFGIELEEEVRYIL